MDARAIHHWNRSNPLRFALGLLLLSTAPLAATSPDDYQRRARASEWEVLFDDGISAKEYAKQLDYFHVELGAEDAGGKIQYAADLGRPKPERRSGSRQDEHRVTIGWKKGTLVAVDRKLLAKAGISTQGKKLLHFYPTEVEQQLFELETAYQGEEPERIARTRFKVRANAPGDGYEFYVDEQELKSDSPGNVRPSAGRAAKPDRAAGGRAAAD